ncbi:MAG: hypothetical protein O3A20_00045 [Planctomycetota bacterium]|nr:hypothetical protein [Planctomycetota bacterium]
MQFRPILLIAGAAAAGVLAFSCGGGSEPVADTPVNPEARAKFDGLCATCHGTSGKGDGAAAAALNPKPRDYTDKAWQKTVTDEFLTKIIVQGGAAVGKSMLMPANADLADKPEVVAGLVKIIRGFAK